jgi:Mn2+/Fe2+ NRAMP family transporter
LPFTLSLAILTIITIIAEVIIPYPKYVGFLKYLALTVFAYVIAAFAVNINWVDALHHTIIPHLEWNMIYVLNITAMLGTTISPYLFFWQADEEVEEEITHNKIRAMGRGMPKISTLDISQMRTDTAIGMFVSNLITFFIIVTAASTLRAQGITEVTSAAQVASALKPLAGEFSSLLFAIGIIGTGMLAVPVLAGSAAYAISEAFGWREGLGKTFSQARAFYGVIIIATLIGLLVNITSISPISMLYYSAILNGLLAPPLMILIILIANNKEILGNRVNGRLQNILAIIITTIMSALTLYFLYSLL